MSYRSHESDAETRRLVGIIVTGLTAIGLFLVVWPITVVVEISCLMAVVALLIGSVQLFVATILLFEKDAS